MNSATYTKITVTLSILLSINIMYSREYAQRPLYSSAEYLFWKPHADQLSFALNFQQGVPDNALIGTPCDFAVYQQFRASSGGRLKAGFFFADDCDIRFIFTQLHNHSNTCISNNTLGVFASPFLGFLNEGQIVGTAAQSNWRLHYTTIAVELARDFCFCDSFFIRPHLGFLWTHINQRQCINFSNVFLDEKVAVLATHVDRTNNFKAAGPRLGVESSYYLNNTIYCMGNIALATVYGKFNAQADYTLRIKPNNQPVQNFTPVIISPCKKRLRPTLQLLIGLGWDMVCCDNIFEICAAYEANYWWNQWQVPGSLVAAASSTIAAGDLMLHGLTMHVGFRF